jgi:hypothetical protein
MAIRFACPECSWKYVVNDRCLGVLFQCRNPECGRQFTVPSTQSPPGRQEPDARSGPQGKSEFNPPPLPHKPSQSAEDDDVWFIYRERDDEKLTVSYDDLYQMAADGRLKRRDFVKKKGTGRWRRAGRIAELWPEKQPTPEEASLLTKCGACISEIAKEAPSCPKCGAPNKWIHPQCLRFLDRLRRFQRKYPNFQAEAKGFLLVCRSTRDKQFADYAANAIGGMGFWGPMSLGGLAMTLGASIGSQYAAKAIRDKAGPHANAFVIDFRHDPPTWSSTNDEFW